MKKIAKCKKCRREKTKLFLKGEKCSTSKCPLVRKPYPPGVFGSRMKARKVSEYGKQLREKQKLKRIFGISENQLKKYFLKARKDKENTEEILLSLLERRLDNVVFRLGFAESRSKARQLISHKHFLINNQRVNIPSFQVKKGDKICLKKPFKKCFENLPKLLKKHHFPSWLELDIEKLEGKVISLPFEKDFEKIIDISLIIEYYSK